MSGAHTINVVLSWGQRYRNNLQKLLDKSDWEEETLFADYALFLRDSELWSEDKKDWSLNQKELFGDVYSEWQMCKLE